MADGDAEAAARAQPTGELAHGLAVAGFSLPALNVAYEATGEFGGMPLYRELGGGGGGIYWTSGWNFIANFTEEAAKAGSCAAYIDRRTEPGRCRSASGPPSARSIANGRSRR